MITTSRRRFLSAAAFAAASIAAPGVLGANERIRVGVIGCRNRGHKVAAAMSQSDRFEIAALCDCDQTMYGVARRELGDGLRGPAEYVEDFRRLLDDSRIDAVAIATPDHWHAAMTILALGAGKHVYVEKPASYNLGDGKRMVQAHARHPKQVCVVGTQQRSGRHFQDARAFVRGGGLGKIAFARAWILHDRGLLPAVPNSDPPDSLNYDLWVGPAPMHPYNRNRCHYNWHWVRDYGTGEMGNWGAHWIDIARWFLGLTWPERVAGAGGQFVQDDIKEWPDTQTVLYHFPETSLLWEQRLWTEHGVHNRRNGAEFAGEKGSLIIDRGGWTFYPKDGRPERHGASELTVAHAANFADAIRGTAQPHAGLEEGHISAALCHLGNIAGVLGREIRFDPKAYAFLNDAEADRWRDRPYRSPWDDRVA